MNKHLKLVREFHEKFAVVQPDYPETAHLSDMDILMRQSLLLKCGSETFEAIAVGDQSKILAGLVDLAYNALAAIACHGGDVLSVSVSWRQDGSVLSVARGLSDKINNCTSGETLHYSALYGLCYQLVGTYVNADFDKAFLIVHTNLVAQAGNGVSQNSEQRIERATFAEAPDLSAAFYE